MFAPSSVRPVANSREHSHPLLATGSIKECGCCSVPCDGRSEAIPIITREVREFDCARLMPASSRSTRVANSSAIGGNQISFLTHRTHRGDTPAFKITKTKTSLQGSSNDVV